MAYCDRQGQTMKISILSNNYRSLRRNYDQSTMLRYATGTLGGIAHGNDGSRHCERIAVFMSTVNWALLLAANDITILFIEK